MAELEEEGLRQAEYQATIQGCEGPEEPEECEELGIYDTQYYKELYDCQSTW